MKPFKLVPAYKDYIWGGKKLKEKYGKNTEISPLAESWELSCHDDGLSVIKNGEYAGKTLKEFLAENKSALGSRNNGDELPVLIKLIDAADNLSVQVHPDDEMAKKLENQNGKTEMWYVVEADKNAQIIYGLKNETTKDELRSAIEENRVMPMLDSCQSNKGDVFFVEAGTVHAIGKGNLIAEIQQNSNVTYRMYDYDRRDKDGNPRQLHIEKGVQAANTSPVKKRSTPMCSDGSRLLGTCEFFQVKEFVIKGEKAFNSDMRTYKALLVTDGSAVLKCGADEESINKGECVFIPAGTGEYAVVGNCTILETSNPPRYFVGVDLGGTNIAAAVVDEDGVIYGRASTKTKSPRPYNEIFDDMAMCARKCAENSGIPFEDIECVGIGCPGALDLENGIIENSNNLKFFNAPITSYMENALGKKVYIENDANAAAWGEFLAGSGRNTKSMVMVTLGTGVGGGIIENGRLLRGAYDKGAELGHMTIVVNGKRCTCGRQGCLEAYASATALIRMTRDAMKKNPDSDLWKMCRGKLSNVNGATAFRCKDDTAREVVRNYLNYLAEGVVNIVNMLQPEVVCIGGGISHEGRRILAPVLAKIKNKSFARFGKNQSTAILAELGNDAGIIGAALLWKNDIK